VSSVVRVLVGSAIAALLGMGVGGVALGIGWYNFRPEAEKAGAARPERGERPERSGRPDRPTRSPRARDAEVAPVAAPLTASTTVAGAEPSPSSIVGPDGLPTRFALGINEALSVPHKAVKQGQIRADGIAGHLERDTREATALGARFVRGNSGAFPRSSWWSSLNEADTAQNLDTWVKAVQAGGFEPILMVSPWPGNRTANHTEHYVPDDMPAYIAWVTATVERYDGDGVDDMPGLRGPIRYWEVDNEPDLKNTNPPKDAVRKVDPATFCTPAEAARVLVATSKAIRAAHPDARVLNGGIYRPFADSAQAYLSRLVAEPGVLEAFDILSLHSYASDEQGEAYARGLAAARKIAGGKPIFVTETSVGDQGEKPYMTEAWQARMVAVAAARGAIAGARAVLWHTLADPPPEGKLKSGFEHNSLLRQSGGTFSEKPAAAAYRNLAARLAEDDLTGAVQDGEGAAKLRSGAVLLYQGTRAAPKGGVSLATGAQVPPGGTAEAPAWLWP
jgi:hypothetical protein